MFGCLGSFGIPCYLPSLIKDRLYIHMLLAASHRQPFQFLPKIHTSQFRGALTATLFVGNRTLQNSSGHRLSNGRHNDMRPMFMKV